MLFRATRGNMFFNQAPAEEQVMDPVSGEMGNWHHEYGKLKAKMEALSKSQRHLMGEQLDTLSLRELQQLENQLDNSLKHIRSRKNQVLLDSISELQRKEKSLQEQNKSLEKHDLFVIYYASLCH
ncbi:MADS-box transcription factor 14-like [Curcuma longa]|uniref:MADS-box transcription factor 14-like n=1 Tax=Curcuma longa TaxID=136217 RepID=UPI003D9DC7CB